MKLREGRLEMCAAILASTGVCDPKTTPDSPWPPRVAPGDVRLPEDLAHPVLQLLARRVHTGSLPGCREDGKRLALAVEGGGMRGVIAAGMLWALGHLGAMRAFDAVYATSAGAINAAFALAGQVDWGASIYFEDVSNGRLVDTFGPLRRKSFLSLEYLLWDIAGGTKLLDFDALTSSGTEFYVIATDLDTGKRVLLSDFPDRDALLQAIQASCSFPRITGQPRCIDGQLLVDGTFSEPIPFHAALDHDATHVLALRSRPTGVVKRAPNAFRRAATRLLLAGVDRRVIKLELTRWKPYAEAVQKLAEGSRDTSRDPALVEVAVGENAIVPSQLATDRNDLVPAFRAGAQVMFDLLATDVRLVETLQPFRVK